MPDSPKCHNCLNAGKLSQTYKTAGQATYKCQVCKSIFSHEDFKPEEFFWKQDLPKWKAFIESRINGKKDSLKDSIREDIIKLEKVVGKK